MSKQMRCGSMARVKHGKYWPIPVAAAVAVAALLVLVLSDSSSPAQAQTTSAVLVGAGDIASCDSTGDTATSRLLGSIAGTVLAIGDNAYKEGTLS
jgi:acid phosphatase type 7